MEASSPLSPAGATGSQETALSSEQQQQKQQQQQQQITTPHMSLESHDLKHFPEALFFGIPSSDSAPSCLDNLISLNLSRNSLRELSDSIGRLTSLKVLDVSRNSLRSLPKTLSNLTNLESLNALSNSLRPTSIPVEQLALLNHLREFDVRFNEKLKGQESTQQMIKDLPSVNVKYTQPKKRDSASQAQMQHACDRDATLLRSQLEPWSTPTLRRRLSTEFGEDTDPDKHNRSYILDSLLKHYETRGPRGVLRFQGISVGSEMVDAIMKELKAWTERVKGKPRERETINAEGYMILRSPEEFSKKDSTKALRAAAKLDANRSLWEIAHTAMKQVDEEYASTYTALAVTLNFVGSPHIDTQNIGPFYGMALGDFSENGGALCVEYDPFNVAFVDTRGRLGKVDGRYPHWVAPYTGNRYSLIFYNTEGVVVPQRQACYSEAIDDEGVEAPKRKKKVEAIESLRAGDAPVQQ